MLDEYDMTFFLVYFNYKMVWILMLTFLRNQPTRIFKYSLNYSMNFPGVCKWEKVDRETKQARVEYFKLLNY